VIFDNKLTFLPHIRYLKVKCAKAQNLLRAVAHTSWGAGQQTLLAYIFIDRLFVLNSTMAVSCVIPRENRIYVYWVRYRTMHCGYASVPSEPHLPLVCVFKPMNLHSTYGEEWWAYSIPSDSAHPRAIRLTILSSFSSQPNQIPTLGIRIAPKLENIYFKRNTVSQLSVQASPPWLLRRPVIELTLHFSNKAVTPP